MPKCDICGEEFDTERGLHIHQSQKHDEEAESEEVDEETEEESVEEDDSGAEEAESVEEEEIVREIDEETEGGLLGGFSRESLVVGGALIGVALGLAIGLFLSQSGGLGPSDGVTADDIQTKMEDLPRANINVSGVTEEESGLFQVNMSTQRGERTIAYFTQDGETMFLNTRFGFQKTTYTSLKDRLENPPEPPQNGNTTTENSTNSTAGNTTQ